MFTYTRSSAIAVLETICAILFLLLAVSVNASPKDTMKADLRLTDLSGKRVDLKDYRGQIVVLNFWATWCGPCQHEMPMLVAAEKSYKPRGIKFIAASLDEAKTRSDISDFVGMYEVNFPVWIRASAGDLKKLGMGDAVPATAFIDQEGRIVARVSGEIRAAELKERLEWLIGGRTGPAPQPRVSHLEE